MDFLEIAAETWSPIIKDAVQSLAQIAQTLAGLFVRERWEVGTTLDIRPPGQNQRCDVERSKGYWIEAITHRLFVGQPAWAECARQRLSSDGRRS